MTWVYSPTSPYSREPADLNSAPASAVDSAPSATSSATATPRASSCPELGGGSSTMPRSGLTLRHLTGDPGVDSWMSFLAASRASRIAQLENIWEQQTKETSGPPTCESCASVGLLSSSQKMSSEFLIPDMPSKSWLALKKQATARPLSRRALVKLGHHTHGPECSFWPTPRAQDGARSRGVLGRDRQYWNLPDAVLNRFGLKEFHPNLPEWLMGWRLGWTELDAVATAWFQTKASPPGRSLKKSRRIWP